MGDRELRLNSVDRYLKSSPKYVLEEHGHCEVPAGCGGVVLRWRNPSDAVPVRLRARALGVAEQVVSVDGTPLRTARPLLPPGRHALTVAIRAEAGTQVRLLLRVAADVGDQPELVSTGRPEVWRWSAVAPPEEWTHPDFDDSAWPNPIRGQLTPEERDSYSIRSLDREGILPVAVPIVAERLWLRTTFHVTPER